MAVVLALVLLAPSASHAAYEHHADKTHAEYTPASDAHERGATDVTSDDVISEQASGQCCGGICLSAIFSDDHAPLPVQATGEAYLMLQEQITSYDLSDISRPPQALI